MLETITTTTCMPAVTSTLNTYELQNSTLASAMTTITTSLTVAAVPHHIYYYHLCEDYVNSLTNKEVACLDNMLEEIISDSKQLIMKKQS